MSNFTLDQKRNLTKAEARHFARMFARDVKKRKAIGRIFIFIFSLLVIIFILLPLILGGDYCLLIIAGVSAPFLLLVIWDYSQVKKNAAANIEMLVSYREGTLRKETISEYAGGRNSIDVDYYFIDDLPIEIPSHWLMLDYLKEGKQYRFEYALRAQIDGLRNHGGGYVADNLTILKKGYLLSVDGYLSLDEELKKGWDHSENKDVIFPFVGALIFSIIFLVNLPGYLNNPSYKPEKLIQYLKYGKATENMVFAPDEIPFEKLRPYNQLNIKDALVINVMEGDNIRTILITNKDSFKKDFETLAADAAWLEGFIHPWTLSMGYYGWDDRDSLLDNNPFYQDLKKESMALVRRNNSILRKYIPYNKSSLIPEYIADEQQKILDQYYL
ncbi:MAG: hypothetical protein PQJ46_04580, partial [Spirochaetales bacterium]|nr:hypothetical protein [Spirochaetales bacterium]